MRKAFIERLCISAREDQRVCLIVGDLGFSVVEPFARAFPDRFLNAGVAEQNMIGMATGWSLAENKIVFVYSIANFPTLRCLEQIRNDVCHHKANVKIVSVGSGLCYGTAGFSHHAVEDLAIMRALPAMVVCSPSDAYESGAVTQLAIETSGPFYIRLGRNNEPQTHPIPCEMSIGSPVLFKKEGDIVLISTGTLVSEVIKAAALLAEQKIQVKVIGLPFLKPLSQKALWAMIRDCRMVAVVEEHGGFGGLGSVIAEILVRNKAVVDFEHMHLPEFLDIVGSQDQLRHFYDLDSSGITEKILQALDMHPPRCLTEICR